MKQEAFERFKAEFNHNDAMLWLQNHEEFRGGTTTTITSSSNTFSHLTKSQAREIAPLLMELAVAQTKDLSVYRAILTLANEGGGAAAATTRQDKCERSSNSFTNKNVVKKQKERNDDDYDDHHHHIIEENHFALYNTTKSQERGEKGGATTTTITIQGQSLLFKAIDIWQQTITPGKLKVNGLISESSAVQSLKDLITIGGQSYVLNSVRIENDKNDDDNHNEDDHNDDHYYDETNNYRENILHHAFDNAGLPMEVFKFIIDVGGKDLLLQRNKKGHTALHLAFIAEMSFSYLEDLDDHMSVNNQHFPKSGILFKDERLEAIKYMIEVGGKDLLLMKCKQNYTFLDYALLYSTSYATSSHEMIKMLIDIGGDELVISEVLFPLLGRSTSLDVVKILVERQGTDLLYAKTSLHETILHIACAHRRSHDFIKYLIDVGQKRLVLMKTHDRKTALDYALGGEKFAFLSSTTLDVVEMLCEVGGDELDFQRKTFHMLGVSTTLDVIKYIVNNYGKDKAMLLSKGKSTADRTKKNNILHHVCGYRERRKEIIQFMIEVAGADIINARNSDKQSAITNLLINQQCPTVEDLKLLLDAVGEKDIMNALVGFPRLFSRNLISFDLVKHLIGRIGKSLVLLNKSGNALFHAWDADHPSEEMIELLLGVGGTEAILARGVDGLNALEKAIEKHGRITSSRMILCMKRMIDLGGKEALFSRSRHFHVSALSIACSEDAIEIARYLCDVGGRDVLFSKGIKIICMDRDKHYSFAIIRLLLEKGIQFKIDGADGIGGFFAALRQGKNVFWSKISTNFNSFKRLINGQPFLQGIIPLILDHPDTPRNLTTKFVAQNFIEWIAVKTSTGVLPIEIAARWNVEWHNGMKEIFEATRTEVVKKSCLCVGAQFGLRWDNKMSDIIQENVCEIDTVDEETGLFPFMLAACEFSDLSVIYNLLVTRSDVLISCVAVKRNTGCKRKADGIST